MRLRTATAAATAALLGVTFAPSAGANAMFTYTPHSGHVGTKVVATGTGCEEGAEEAIIELVSHPEEKDELELPTLTTKPTADGNWKITFAIPQTAKLGKLELFPDCSAPLEEELLGDEELLDEELLDEELLDEELLDEEEIAPLYDGEYVFTVVKPPPPPKKAAEKKSPPTTKKSPPTTKKSPPTTKKSPPTTKKSPPTTKKKGK